MRQGLLARAGTLLAAGDTVGAANMARHAYAIDPWLHRAQRLLLSASQPVRQEILHERAGALIKAGFTATPILAQYLMSAAHLGHGDSVARMTRHGLRRDDLREGEGAPVLHRMFERLRAVVDRYLAEMAQAKAADPTPPFLAGLPSRYRLGGWAVVSDADTHHLPHFHPMPWCNGVYYVEVPPIIAETQQRAGWLHVGPPEDTGADWGEWQPHWIQPEVGRIVLMPSYFHHHTVPLGVDQRRICVAFEIYPEDSPVLRNSEFWNFA